MSTLRKIERLTVEEYLRLELNSDERHEYVRGFIYAMVGATAAHNIIALRIASTLLQHIDHHGGPCKVFASDMKVRTDNAFYYPDVLVACGHIENDSVFQAYPSVIIEVLSESTESRDRLEKLAAYQSISSLHEYALVSQDNIAIDIYRRTGQSWQVESLSRGDVFRLTTLNFEISIEHIYKGLDL